MPTRTFILYSKLCVRTRAGPRVEEKQSLHTSSARLVYSISIVSVEALTSSAPGGQRGCRLHHVSDAEAIVGNELLEQSDDIC